MRYLTGPGVQGAGHDPVGILIALMAVVVSMSLDHGNVTDLIKIPAILLVLGGSLGATVAGFDKRRLRAVPKAIKLVMKPGHPPDMKGTIDTLLTIAKEVRQNPLVLEQLETDDAFLKMGIQVITSTSDPERVHELLGAEVDRLRSRHATAIKFFSDMAGYSPTFGILGTVIGLIGVLGQLSEPANWARPLRRRSPPPSGESFSPTPSGYRFRTDSGGFPRRRSPTAKW